MITEDIMAMMKFEVLQETLQKGVGFVLKAVGNRPQLPVLSNILIIAQKEGVTLISTDLEIGSVIRLGAKVETEGRVTVPARMLSDFVGTLPPGKVVVELDKDTLRIVGGRYSAQFQTIPAQEFPEVPMSVDREKAISFASHDLARVVERVGFSAAKDLMRPVLTGVLFEFAKGKVNLVATDGFRLSSATLPFKGEVQVERLLLPARILMEVVKAANEETVYLQPIPEANQVIFGVGEVILVSQVLGGDFPEYRRIIPTEFTTEVVFDHDEVMQATKSVLVFAKDNSNVVRWSVNEEGVTMTAESPEMGKSTVTVPATVNGDGGEIAFNGKFLLDFFQAAQTERLWFGMNERLTPGQWREEGDSNFLYVVMPINV